MLPQESRRFEWQMRSIRELRLQNVQATSLGLLSQLLLAGMAVSQQPTIEELVRLLKARDAATPLFETAFQIRVLNKGSLSEFLNPNTDRASSSQLAVSVRWQTSCAGFAAVTIDHSNNSRTLASWDGVTFSKLTTIVVGNPTSPSHKVGPDTFLIRGTLEPWYVSIRPGRFGLEHATRTWQEVLSKSSGVRILGRETVSGRDCLKVVYDNAPPSEPHQRYQSPEVVWFDDNDTMIAIKFVAYALIPPDSSIHSNTEQIVLDGMTYYPHYLEHLLSVNKVSSRLVLAKDVLRVFMDSRTQEVIKAELFTFNSPSVQGFESMDKELARLALVEGTRVVDERFDQRFVVQGGAWVPAEEYEFRACVESLAKQDGARLPRWNQYAEPRERNSCGPLALAAASALSGIATSPDAITRLLPGDERLEGRASLDSLERAARSLGLYTAKVRLRQLEDVTSRYTLTLIDTNFSESRPHKHMHWVIATPVDAGIRLVSPPTPPKVLSRNAFDRTWTHVCLVVSRDPIADVDRVLEIPRVAAVAIGLGCCVAGVWLAFRGTRNSHSRPAFTRSEP
jgi:hypothetical protein